MILSGTSDPNVQTQPTRALWIGSIPSSTTPNHLVAIFNSFGPIESARVLTHKSCGVSSSSNHSWGPGGENQRRDD